MARSSFFINERMENLFMLYKSKFGGQTDALMIILDRYNTLVSHERKLLKTLFTEQEISFLCSLLPEKCLKSAGVIPDFFFLRVTAQDKTSFPGTTAARTDLLKKLKQLSLGQEIALLDYIESLRVSEQ